MMGQVGSFLDAVKAVESTHDENAQILGVLEWVSTALGAAGSALIDLQTDPERPNVLSALGTLSQPSGPGGLMLSLDGSRPKTSCGVTLMESGGKRMEAYFHPIWNNGDSPRIALLLQPAGVLENASRHGDELAVAAFLLRGIRERSLLREQVEREKAFIGLLVDKKLDTGAVSPGFDLITEGLNLPLYMCSTAGVLAYASPAFLALVGYASVEEIRGHADFFLEPQSRAAELVLLRAQGKVAAHPLTVRAGDGRRLEIQDSAVRVGAFVFGVFFDITGFLAANRELTDALEVQELLNDRFIAATQILQRTQATSIRALARLAEFRDQETGFHLQRMCEYTRMIAQQVFERKPYSFQLTSAYPTDISLSSMLHDIGKVCIPDSILLKKGKLDAEEWEIMKKHTTAGWEILHKADKELGEQSFLTLASTIALSHHERYDGLGYPSGLVGERIPLSARISALADVYDALTTTRPYKEAWDHETACAEISKGSGTQFDPVVVDIFLSMESEFDGIRRVFPG